MTTDARRPLASRKITFFHRLASFLVKRGITPNQISVTSAFFGLFAGLAFYLAANFIDLPAYISLLLAMLFVQLRLVCNLIDGLMAVENGLKTDNGDLYNEVPDRVADSLILLGAGYGAARMLPHALELGWLATVLAIATAYIRCLGAAVKGVHIFVGPMAKPQRMFLITIAGVGSMIELYFGFYGYSLSVALALIALGSLITCIRRLGIIARTKKAG